MSAVDSPSVIARLARPFWNREEARLRAFWRILLPVGGLLVANLAVTAALAGRAGLPFLLPAVQLPQAVLTLGVAVAWARYVDRRPLADYGFHLGRDWWLDLGAGLAVGTAIYLGAFLTNLALGWATVTAVFSPGEGSAPFVVGFGAFLLAFGAVAVWEELAFRGLFLKNALEGLAGWLPARAALAASWLLVSVVFGLGHLPGVPSPLAVLYWILLGGLLGLAYLQTGELALPVGLHFAVNTASTTVFDLTGAEAAPAVVRLAATGPEPFVGAAGLVNVAFAVVGYGLVLAWIARREDARFRTELARWTPRDGDAAPAG